MSTPPAMTKTTTSAATIRARVLLTRIPPSMCMGALHPPVTDGRLSEGGRSSPVEAGGDRAVDSHRLWRKLPRAQREAVWLAPAELAGAKGGGGERPGALDSRPGTPEAKRVGDQVTRLGADQAEPEQEPSTAPSAHETILGGESPLPLGERVRERGVTLHSQSGRGALPCTPSQG